MGNLGVRISFKNLVSFTFLFLLGLPAFECFAEKAKTSERDKSFMLGSFRSDKDKNEDQTIFIRSDSLNVDAKKRVFSYKGNVEVIRGDVQITAQAVRGSYNAKNEMQEIFCEDSVVITRGSGERASANRAIYDVPGEIIRLTEDPELYKDGSILSADIVKVYTNEDRSEAEGNVRVKVLNSSVSSESSSNQEAVFDPLVADSFEEDGLQSGDDLSFRDGTSSVDIPGSDLPQ